MRNCLHIILLILSGTVLNFTAHAADWRDSLRHIYNLQSKIDYLESQMAQKTLSADDRFELNIQLANQYTQSGNYIQAEELLNSAENLMNRQSSEQHISFLTASAHWHKYQNKNDQALKLYFRANQMAIDRNMTSERISTGINLAEFYRKIAKYQEAATEITAVESFYNSRDVKDTALLIRLYGRAAAIEFESRLLPDTNYAEKALELSRLYGDRESEASSLNEIAYRLKNNLRFDEANRLYREAESIWKSLGHKSALVHTMTNRAMSLQSENFQNPEAKELYLEIIDLVKSDSISFNLARPYAYLQELSLFEGDSAQAYYYFRKYHEEMLDKMQATYNAEVQKLTLSYENEKTKNELAMARENLNRKKREINQREHENRQQSYSIVVLSILLLGIVILTFLLRKRNQQLRQKNKEKDVLIQEIHHRVKNNLQFVSSIMNMQIARSETSQEKESLGEASRRIKSMALVHEMLYSNDHMEGIKIRQYLEELKSSLEDLISHQEKHIQFEMDVVDAVFDVSSAIALGMISSEFISNSFKHAFDEVSAPKIDIKLDQSKSVFVFEIKDNGPGFDQNSVGEDSLGLRLIDIFSRQLKGTYELKSENGSRFIIEFKLKK